MSRTLFNDGWTVGPKNSVWAQLSPSPDGVTPVTLPHDQLIGQVRTAEGTGRTAYFPNSSEYEYIKRFDAPEEWRGRRVWVEFEAAYRDAMVYVNGARAAHWPNGYSTARVALDDFLRYGEQNTIRVEVRAHDDSRWYTGVGLLRDVHLIVSDLVHVGTEEIFVTTPDVDEHRAVVEAAIPVTNAGLSTTTVIVDTLILDDAGREVAKNSAPITLRGGETATTRQRLYVRNPRRWSTQHPTLYEVRVMVRDATAATTRDEARTTLGIRTLQVDPIFGLRINGEVVNLRGACIHHDNGILGGAGIGRAEERKIELLKEAGFNAIRSSHNPLSATMLDACDRLGMLVMDEAFDAWTENKTAFDYSLAFGDWWERDLEAMIRKDKNHPSVIMYSIGNEIPESGNPIGANWSRRLAEKVRELDDTRYVTNAVNGFVAIISDVATMLKERISAVSPAGEAGASPEGGVNAAGQWMNEIGRSPLVSVRIEEALSTSDIAGLNYSESRYESDRSEYPNRIIVGTETFPKSIASNWKLVENNPHVLGDFTWTGWDYLGEVGIGRLHYSDEENFDLEAPYPWLTAWCGDLDITGYRRPQSYYREIVFGLRDRPYIAVDRPVNQHREPAPAGSHWAWPDAISSWTWDVEAGTPLSLEVYSSFPEVELILNGRAVGRASAGAEHAFRASFEVGYEPGELVAVAYQDGREVSRTSLVSVNGTVAVRLSADRLVLSNSSGDLSHIAIEIVDAAGTLVTNRDRVVHVSVSGSGALQALGTGRPNSTEPYAALQCTTFDGRALAIIRPTSAGEVTVLVRVDEEEPVELRLTVESHSERVDALLRTKE